MRVLAVLGLAVMPAAVFGFEPGSLGSDYRDTGYVQGCTDEGELPGCSIVSGGSQFVVAADGPTEPEVMAKLRDLPQLAWVAFRGDILDVYDSYAGFVLGAISGAPEPDPYGETVRALQGRWISTDDPLSAVMVDGMIWTDLYDGPEVARSVINLGPSCSDGSGEGMTVLELFAIGSADTVSLCYAVDTVDGDRLELTYLARGNTLVFERP